VRGHRWRRQRTLSHDAVARTTPTLLAVKRNHRRSARHLSPATSVAFRRAPVGDALVIHVRRQLRPLLESTSPLASVLRLIFASSELAQGVCMMQRSNRLAGGALQAMPACHGLAVDFVQDAARIVGGLGPCGLPSGARTVPLVANVTDQGVRDDRHLAHDRRQRHIRRLAAVAEFPVLPRQLQAVADRRQRRLVLQHLPGGRPRCGCVPSKRRTPGRTAPDPQGSTPPALRSDPTRATRDQARSRDPHSRHGRQHVGVGDNAASAFATRWTEASNALI